MTTTQQIQDAQALARRTLAGTDPALSWREAGYSSAIEAARVLVGSDADGDVAEMAAEIVAEKLAD